MCLTSSHKVYNHTRRDATPSDLVLSNNKYAELSSEVIQDFGSRDFTVKFRYRGLGQRVTPDGSYGALFIRSDQGPSPYTGPWTVMPHKTILLERLPQEHFIVELHCGATRGSDHNAHQSITAFVWGQRYSFSSQRFAQD